MKICKYALIIPPTKNDIRLMVLDLSKSTLDEILSEYSNFIIHEHFVKDLTISIRNLNITLEYSAPSYHTISNPQPFDDIDWSCIQPEVKQKLEDSYTGTKHAKSFIRKEDGCGVYEILTSRFPKSLFKKDSVKTIMPKHWYCTWDTYYLMKTDIFNKTQTRDFYNYPFSFKEVN